MSAKAFALLAALSVLVLVGTIFAGGGTPCDYNDLRDCYLWGPGHPEYHGYCCKNNLTPHFSVQVIPGSEMFLTSREGDCGRLTRVEVGPLGDSICGDYISECGGQNHSTACTPTN